jgi:hypothetical protein
MNHTEIRLGQNMLKNSSLKRIGCAVLGLFGAGWLLVFYLNYEKTGTATNLQSLPQYGELFTTNVPASELRYSYHPSSRQLLVAGRISESNFKELCKMLRIEIVGYTEGNWPRLDDIPETYLPTGHGVDAGLGKAYSEGRAIIHVYYSPLSDQQKQEGSFYIHIR